MRYSFLRSILSLLLSILLGLLAISCSNDDDDDDDDTPSNDDDVHADDDDTHGNDDDDDMDDCVSESECTPYQSYDGCECVYPCGEGPEFPPVEEGTYAPFEGALKANVEVLIDEWGMSHIYASNIEDAVFAEGYRQAHDRLFQMELTRRLVAGTQAEVFGEEKLARDKESRVAGFVRQAEDYWPRLKERYPSVARQMEAYVAGVNAYLADAEAGRNGASFSEEWDAVQPGWRPEPWSPIDVYAFAMAQAFALSFHGDIELIYSAAVLLLGPEVTEDLIRAQPLVPTYVLEEGPSQFPDEFSPSLTKRMKNALTEEVSPNLDLQGVLDLAVRWRDFTESFLSRSGGSNNWTVAGKHTASGKALVADDPHLGTDLPANFWEVHLAVDDEDVNVSGITIPGFPGVLIGHNEYVGWGFTTTFGDVADIYLEAISSDGTMTRLAGEDVPLVFIDEPIKVRPEGGAMGEAETIDFTVRIVPHHGPIMNDLLPESFSNAIPFQVSFRWVGFEPIYTPGFVAKAPYAKNFDEYRDILDFWGVGAQSHNVGDTEGNIAFWGPSYYPDRQWDFEEATPSEMLYSDGQHEWCGYLSFDEGVPQTMNPEKGYIVTANNVVYDHSNDNNPNNDGRFFGRIFASGARAHRITNRLEELIDTGDPLTLEQMQNIQNDVHSVMGDQVLPYSITEGVEARVCADEETTLCRAYRRLESWDRENDVDSVGATVYQYWLTYALIEIFQDDIATMIWGAVSNGDLFDHLFRGLRLVFAGHEFPSGRNYPDNLETEGVVETLEDNVVIALEKASAHLEGAFGADLEEWRWGNVHFKTYRHLSGIADYDRGPYSLPGGNLNVARADFEILAVTEDDEIIVMDPPLEQDKSASMRYTVEMDPANNWPHCNVIPGGNSGRPDDPHYDDQLALWVAGECKEVPFVREDVEAAARKRQVLPGGFPDSGSVETSDF